MFFGEDERKNDVLYFAPSLVKLNNVDVNVDGKSKCLTARHYIWENSQKYGYKMFGHNHEFGCWHHRVHFSSQDRGPKNTPETENENESNGTAKATGGGENQLNNCHGHKNVH